jgi:hypothetical protein
VIQIRNVGTITAANVYVGFAGLTAHDGDHPTSEPSGNDEYILQQIIVTKVIMYSDVNPGSGFDTEDLTDAGTANAYLAFWGAPQDGSISLWDLKYYGMPAGDPTNWFWFENGNVVTPNTAILPAGGVCSIQFYFQLLPETNNYAQGDYVTFDASFYATQLMPS